MVKKKSGGMNKKLLNQMTDSAIPMERDKPMLHMTGKEAKAMHGMKPGAKVKMQVHGKVMSVGMSRYGPEKGSPEAEIEIHGMKMMHGKKDMEGMKEDKAEVEEE